MASYSNRIVRSLTCSLLVIVAMILITSMASATTTGPYAYITNSGDKTVSVIDTQSNTVIATIPVGGIPGGVAVSPDGNKIYVTSYNITSSLANDNGKGIVSVIDGATNTVTATVSVGFYPTGVTVSPDGNKIYVTNSKDNDVSVVNTQTNAVIATIPVGLDPRGVAVNPDGNKIYVINNNYNGSDPGYHGNGTVSVIDAATNKVIATLTVGSLPKGIAVTRDGSKIFVTNFKDNSVSVIDAATNSEIARVPAGNGPYGVAVNPAGTKIYVANFNDRNVSVIDAATNKVIATILVGAQPEGVSVTPDGNKIYVVNNYPYNGNTVSAIDASTNTVIATVNVGDKPIAMGQFIVPAPKTAAASSMPSSASSGSTAAPFVGVEGIGAIFLGAAFCMLARRNRN